MSTERSSNPNRPLRPTIASNRPARTPVTPRVAGSNNVTVSASSGQVRPPPLVKSQPATPRIKQTDTPVNSAIASGNVTPRSSARSSRVDSTTSTPSRDDGTPTAPRPKSVAAAGQVSGGAKSGLSISGGVRTQAARPKSLASETGSTIRSEPPLVRSPGVENVGSFFRASDAPTLQEQPPKKPEPKKPAAFFYANGEKEYEASSPVLSAVSDQRSAGPWIRSELVSSPPMSPPILSPGLSALSSASPFFAPSLPQRPGQRSPSPSKENIHLSYRKGVSQIIGIRTVPSPRSTKSVEQVPTTTSNGERRVSHDTSTLLRHHKSPSLSSIDSGNSHLSRRRSATNIEAEPGSSPLGHGVKAATLPRVAKPLNDIPTIDTSLESSTLHSPHNGPLSPTKGVPDLAAEARRERKVLDLEISNSSLLAINASLEREVRRQKTELKRFRRLSRAGRFSTVPGEWPSSRMSDGLSVVGEEDEDDGDNMFGPASGLSELYDDMSDDDDDDSLTSSTEPLSPSARSNRERDRLAKDERRLQVDLEKHKELLVQSQAMNQSIKRCTYATEDMIREGKKALEYHVRVSDVKLGGRVLSSHDDEDDYSQEIEVGDDLDQAKGFLDVWGGVGRPNFEGSESGDRDSGVEVDRTSLPTTAPIGIPMGNMRDDRHSPESAILGARIGTPGLS